MDVWKRAGFETRIETEDGPEVIVYREGLNLADAVIPQLRMMDHNPMAYMVPCRYELVDGSLRLRYRISGLRPLSLSLQTYTRKDEQWDGLLTALKYAVLESKAFLIRETEIVLDPDWIWAGDDIRSIRLMPVPIRGFGSPEFCWEQWKNLFECMVRNGLPPSWQVKLRPSQWEKNTFSHKLWMEMLEIDAQVESPQLSGAEAPIEIPRENRSQPLSNSVIGAPLSTAEDGETLRFQASAVTKKDVIRLLASLALWIVFAVKPSSLLFLLACLGCIPLGISLYRKYKQEGEKKGTVEEAAAPETVYEETAISQPLEHRTVLLPSPEKTILLSAMKDECKEARFELAFEGSDRIETIRLSDGPLRLGRGPAGVDVVVDHAAVSRLHIEMFRENGEDRVRDLGSTNGSFLNEQAMVPHEPYALQPGDVIRLPGATMTYLVTSETG